MKDKFIEVEDMLFLECEPELLDIDKHGKSLVRYIQDDTRMGLYNKEAVCEEKALEKVLLYEPRDIYIAGDHHTRFEVIAKHCPEGSREWALWKILNGEMVHRSGFPYKALDGEIYCTNSAGEIYPATSYQLWLENKAKDGWKIYEEPEIVAHTPKATCLVCGKEIEGLLDRHATVSIKRYSISSLYESTYSHYCGKCFLELGFDATERELRNRQQPIAEPKPAKEQFEVGDWVEMDYKGTLYHRQVISVHDNGIRVEFGGATPLICFDGKSSMLLIRLVRKLKPNEVEVDFGFAKGRILSRTSGDVKVLNNKSVVIATIIVSEITNPATRELVEGLLEAQEEEE